MHPLFVYGSLKQGFPNDQVNQGRRVAGEFKTLLRHPFFLIRGQLPCLLPADGSGFQVLGQLFDVSGDDLAAMDALERVGQPGGYRRVEIDVLAADDPAGPRCAPRPTCTTRRCWPSPASTSARSRSTR